MVLVPPVIDRIGGWFTVFIAGLMAFLILFAIVWLVWGPPTKSERINDLEDRVARLESERR